MNPTQNMEVANSVGRRQRLWIFFMNAPLAVGFVLLAVGVLLREFVDLRLLYFILGGISIGCFVASQTIGKKRPNVWIIWSCCSATILAGMVLHELKKSDIQRRSALCPATENWQPVQLIGRVASIPRFRRDNSFAGRKSSSKDASEVEWMTTIDVSYSDLVASDSTKLTIGQGLVRIAIPGRLREFATGDLVECFIRWRRIPPPSNPGEQNIAERFKRQGIFAQGTAKTSSQIRKIRSGSWLNLNYPLSRFAMAGDAAFHRYVPFAQAELASALVLGQRDQIEWKLQESLLETGTIHMLAISGLHVEMVAISIGSLCVLVRLSHRKTLLIVAISIIAYTFLCGANAPVLRAMFAVVVLSIARFFGLKVNAYNLLSLAAFLLLALRTDYLWDTGTQLSFIAVAMLILAAGTANNRIKIDPLDKLIAATESNTRRFIRWCNSVALESLRVSWWVWLITTPIVFYTFHVVSPIAMLMNLLLLIPLWVGLLSGLLLQLFATWLPLVGWPLGFICGGCLWLTESAIEVGSRLPLSHWWSPTPPKWWLISYYIIFAMLLLWFGFDRRGKRLVLLTMTGLLCAGCLPWYLMLPQETLKRWGYFEDIISIDEQFAMTVVDVGHGTGILLQMPNGENWLYDAGRFGNPDRAFYPIANTLWHLHVKHIDRLILSHADADHYNAIRALLKRFTIRRLCTTQQVMQASDPLWLETLNQIKSYSIPIDVVQQDDMLNAGDVTCRVLHPAMNEKYATDNASSLSLLIEYGDHRFLLPGDLEGAGTRQLLQQHPMKVDVLMAPHHGSLAENPEAILSWCKPDHVVISGADRANRLAVFQAFAGSVGRDVWLTARDNAIRFSITSDDHLHVRQWNVDHWKAVETLPVPINNNEAEEDEVPSLAD
jgi:competence protein ComEC